MLWKFSDTQETFWTLWKFLVPSIWTVEKFCGHYGKYSGHSEEFLDTLEAFQTLWKISGYLKKFLDTLENFHTLRKTLWILWKVSGHSYWFIYRNLKITLFNCFYTYIDHKTCNKIILRLLNACMHINTLRFLLFG